MVHCRRAPVTVRHLQNAAVKARDCSSGRAHRFTSEEGRAAAQKKVRVNSEAKLAA
jgi:hypothetical protein